MTQSSKIKNNDDWIAAASGYHTEVLTKFLLGKPMTEWEQRFCNVLRAVLGPPPESPTHFAARIMNEPVEEKW